VALVGAVGTDSHGDMIVDHAHARGIDISHVRRTAGTTASNVIDLLDSGEASNPPGAWHGGVYETFRPSEEDWAFVECRDLVFIGSLDPSFSEAAWPLTSTPPPTPIGWGPCCRRFCVRLSIARSRTSLV
jgi:sugar/nucleoside kinase (ribokinase family)